MTRKLVSLVLALALILVSGSAMAESVIADRVHTEADNELMLYTPFIDKLASNPQIYKDIAEKEGITIMWVNLPDEYKEFWNLKIISGEYPDYVRDLDFVTYSSWVDQGVLAELPVDFFKENAPDWAAWAEKYAGENVWKYYERDGKNYAGPQQWTLAADNVVLGIREDLFKKAGASIPTTIEECDEAFQKLKDIGVYAISGTKSGDNSKFANGFDWVFGAYGSFQNWHEGEDGEIECGMTNVEANKKALAKLNEWYEKGFIDPEFMVSDRANLGDKWNENKIAMVQNEWYAFIPADAFYEGYFYESCVVANPDAEITIIDPITGDGTHSGYSLGHPVNAAGINFGITMEDNKDKMARYLQFFNKYSFTEEAMDLLNWGYEGVSYTYDEQNGVQWLEGFTTQEEREAYGIGIYEKLPGCLNDYERLARYMIAPKYVELRNEAPTHSGGKMDLLNPIYRPVYNEKKATLDSIVSQAFGDMVLGTRPVDDLDKVYEEWLAAGGQEIMDEAREIYAGLK